MHFNQSPFRLLKAFNPIFLYSFPFSSQARKESSDSVETFDSEQFLPRKETRNNRIDYENKLILFFDQDKKIRDQLPFFLKKIDKFIKDQKFRSTFLSSKILSNLQKFQKKSSKYLESFSKFLFPFPLNRATDENKSSSSIPGKPENPHQREKNPRGKKKKKKKRERERKKYPQMNRR